LTVQSRQPAARRVYAVDVLRGIVLVLLLPDLQGGFSFYKVAQALPHSEFWAALATQFRHVDWTGVAIWDLVMPLFVFLAGVSMALSYSSRLRDGQSAVRLFGHALLRSVTLLVLGLLLQYEPQDRLDETLPVLLVSTGLPIGRWLKRWSIVQREQQASRVEAAFAVLVLAFVVVWISAHYERLGFYDFGSQILTLLGLAYLPAFALQRYGARTQALAALLITAAYGGAFMLYSAPASMHPGAGVFDGWFAHWNQGANVAAAFDQWFFALLPRAQSYTGNPHDYHSLLFIALIGVILAGSAAGRLLFEQGASRALALRFAAASLAGLLLSGLMSFAVAPLLKSLWTPTWSVFCVSICLLLLSALMLMLHGRERPGWTVPLVVLGTNSILLYVLAFTQRGRIVHLWQRVLGPDLGASLPWEPLVECGLVLGTLWALAFVLYRAKIFVRI